VQGRLRRTRGSCPCQLVLIAVVPHERVPRAFESSAKPRLNQTCPVCTKGGTRRVQLVREGGGASFVYVPDGVQARCCSGSGAGASTLEGTRPSNF